VTVRRWRCARRRPPSLNNLGVVWWPRTNWMSASAAFRHAIELNPKYCYAHNNSATCWRPEAVGRSIWRIQEGHRTQPQIRGAPLQPRHRAGGQEAWDEAIGEYKKAIELNPKYAEPHNNLATCWMPKKQWDEAIGRIQKAIELNPKYATAHNNLGSALAARTVGRSHRRIPPGHRTQPQARSGPPRTSAARWRPRTSGTKPLGEFKKAIELDPKEARPTTTSASRWRPEAVGRSHWRYKKAIELDPKFAPAHYNLGNVLHARTSGTKPLANTGRHELDPKYATAHNNLGSRAGGQEPVGRSIAAYRKAIELDPKNALAHYKPRHRSHGQEAVGRSHRRI